MSLDLEAIMTAVATAQNAIVTPTDETALKGIENNDPGQPVTVFPFIVNIEDTIETKVISRDMQEHTLTVIMHLIFAEVGGKYHRQSLRRWVPKFYETFHNRDGTHWNLGGAATEVEIVGVEFGTDRSPVGLRSGDYVGVSFGLQIRIKESIV